MRRGHEQPAHVPHLRGRLDVGADHEARRIDEAHDRQPVRVAQLHEACCLVRRVSVDRAAQMQRIVRDQSDRPAVDPCERGVDSGAEAGAQHQQAVLVDEAGHRRSGVVHTQPVLGHDMAQRALIRRAPVRRRALEEPEVASRGSDRLALVVDEHIDHAVRVLDLARPDLLGRKHAEAAAFDHCGPAHPDVAVARRDDHVAAAEQCCVPRETAARRDADDRHLTRQRRVARERAEVEPGGVLRIDVARPTAAAFGEQHDRQLLLQRQLEHPVGLRMVVVALRAGQHGCVVRHHRRARARHAEQRAVHAADPGDDPVSRRIRDQIV